MDNEKLLITIKDMFENKLEEVKRHTGALYEALRGDVKAVTEGHSILNDKLDRVELKVDKLETKVDKLEIKVDNLETKFDILEVKVDKLAKDVIGLKSDMTVVKNHVIAVDTKLNEHEIILKR